VEIGDLFKGEFPLRMENLERGNRWRLGGDDLFLIFRGYTGSASTWKCPLEPTLSIP